MKVLYYLIVFGAKWNYHNIHLRSVEQYAKDNHLINYIVQKALSQRVKRNKHILRVLHKALIHPLQYEHHFTVHPEDLDPVHPEGVCCDDNMISFQFPTEENMINFNISFRDSHHIDNQIRSNIQNIQKSLQFIKKNKSKRTRKKVAISGELERLEMEHQHGDRVYLLKDIVNIIYSMII